MGILKRPRITMTEADTREVLNIFSRIENSSGRCSIYDPKERAEYEASELELAFEFRGLDFLLAVFTLVYDEYGMAWANLNDKYSQARKEVFTEAKNAFAREVEQRKNSVVELLPSDYEKDKEVVRAINYLLSLIEQDYYLCDLCDELSNEKESRLQGWGIRKDNPLVDDFPSFGGYDKDLEIKNSSQAKALAALRKENTDLRAELEALKAGLQAGGDTDHTQELGRKKDRGGYLGYSTTERAEALQILLEKALGREVVRDASGAFNKIYSMIAGSSVETTGRYIRNCKGEKMLNEGRRKKAEKEIQALLDAL